jgi:hypothetical protein
MRALIIFYITYTAIPYMRTLALFIQGLFLFMKFLEQTR